MHWKRASVAPCFRWAGSSFCRSKHMGWLPNPALKRSMENPSIMDQLVRSLPWLRRYPELTVQPFRNGHTLRHAPTSAGMRVCDSALWLFVEGSVGNTDLDAALPLTCPSGTTCTAAGYIDGRRSWTCCDELQCLGDYSNCVDYGEKDLCLGLSEDSCSLLHTSVLSW